MPGPHLIPYSLLTLFAGLNIPALEKSLPFLLSASNSSPVTEYKGFAKLCICLLFYAHIFVHPSSSLLHGSRCMSSIPLIFYLCANINVVFVVFSVFTLQNTSFIISPSHETYYTSIPQSVINENVNNLPIVEVTRLVTNITTLLHLCFLCFISTL